MSGSRISLNQIVQSSGVLHGILRRWGLALGAKGRISPDFSPSLRFANELQGGVGF
jgi:hypothetical protein